MPTHRARPAGLSSFRDFVALAVRTADAETGLARIAGIGVVRVADGAPVERMNVDDLEKAADRLSRWAASSPIVVHDVQMIADFQSKIQNPKSKIDQPTTVLPARPLARIVLPRLQDHGLRTIADCLGVERKESDDLDQEAACLADTFLALLDLVYSMELDTIRGLVQLARGTESSLLDLFLDAERQLIKHAFSKPDRPAYRDDLLVPSRNVEGTGTIEHEEWTDDEEPERLDPDRVAALFGQDGLLARTMDRYEHRPQQIAMARAVTRAFNEDAFLVAEAGTGTGKSLSYLVPAVHWAQQNDQRVIISTNTKNLQEQLFFKDIPFLQKALPFPFQAVLLKGRSNYLCLDRWRAVLAQPDERLSPHEREEVLPLVVWARETMTGDISENIGFQGTNGTLWHKINAEGGACPTCAFREECFVNRARGAAATAHLVIVNHALLFSDLAAENAVLSSYAHLIIDEAHHFEKVAVQHMTVEVDAWRLRNLLRVLYVRDGVESGLFATLRWRAERSPMQQVWKDALSAAVRLGIDSVIEVNRAADAFYDATADRAEASSTDHASLYTVKLRYQADSDFAGFLNERAAPLMDSLMQLRDGLARIGQALSDIPSSWLADRDEFVNTVVSSLEACKQVCDDLALLLRADDPDTVYWVEASRRDSLSACVLIAAPLNVADRLYEGIYSHIRSVVFTSATLAVGERFEYLVERLGLNLVEPERLTTFRAGSPFDFEDQALVCVPAAFPSPKTGAFQQAVSDLLLSLVLATRRGTLVLFTSYGMLNRTYIDVERPLSASGIPVLAQGLSGPRSLLLDRFRSRPGSVLLGTDSFWEGIDVPGEALEIVVLAKLPFAVPTEPMVQAQVERLDKAGRNSFLEYLVPEAVIKFRQGFGRLIRTETDRGAVVILDHRVIGTRYGGLFLDALPTRHRVFRSPDDLVEGVTRWFSNNVRTLAR
ncbi:MAG: DEAD/DEAH box helicase family protein [Candidatus Latescibacteria bacterium]|nr:DEAD/DEAH box helicase family protein [Candidatus Latescibacterota bacterium]